MARRLICLLLVLMLVPAAALSGSMEFAQMTDAELIAIDDELSAVMVLRGLYAYVSLSGQKYHSKPTCSGMKKAMRVPVSDLEFCGYEPCKKCH